MQMYISDVPMMYSTPEYPWPRARNYLKKELSALGDNCEISSDKVVMKMCSVGNNCKIGARSKINNTVIMDNVVIGEK